jgi:ankyrin repeat protein
LLDRGANPNVIDPDDRPALILALSHDQVALAEALLAHGADPKAKTKAGETALFYADEAQGSMATRLTALGVEVNAVDRYGDTALIRAAFGGRASTVRALLKAGALVNATSRSGMSALKAATRSGDSATVDVLLAAHADTSVLDAKAAPR